MAALWPLSRTKEYDINGDPVVGAQAYFYNAGTTTPQTVYRDASLSDAYSSDNPVETDGYGRWPAVYLSPTPGSYRQRVLDADDALIFDDDNVSVPLEATYTPPEAGETSTELLVRTGMLVPFYGTSAPSGWVRANGRSIGSASSGATERANDDCEELFEHLWGVDDTLSVSGGRGANAAADWAANKTIALPDYRDRTFIGLGDMGNSDANRIADTLVDGSETNTTLGATAGASTVTLTEAQMPAHDHDATFTGTPLAPHEHDIITYDDIGGGSGGQISNSTSLTSLRTLTTEAITAGTPAGTIDVADAGSSTAHNNIQPGVFAAIIIKL